MKFFSVLTRRDYTDDDGQSQSIYYKAGYLKVTDGGGHFLQFYHLPDVTYYIFPQDDLYEENHEETAIRL